MNSNRTAVITPILAAILLLAARLPLAAMHATETPAVTIAQNKDVSISLRGSVGMIDGEAGEYVYDEDLGYHRKLSELIWDLKQIGMLGAVASVNIAGMFDINAGAWTALTEGNGEMVDYDWYPDVPGAPSINDWTDRSVSDVSLETGTMLDINLAAKLFKLQNLTFKCIVGYKYDNWEWTDSGQEYIYSTFSFRDTIGSFDGLNVINYEQTFSMFYAGGSISIPLGAFSLNGYALASPFVNAKDHDYHVLREIDFTEDFSNGNYIALGGNITWHITNWFFVGAGIDYQSIPEFTGDMTIRLATGESETTDDAAGISHKALMISGSAGLTF